MPIVSSFAGASSRAYGLSAGGAAPVGFNSIASTTLTGNQSTITFNNIPQTYKHLQLRVFSRVTSGYDNYLYLTMNGVAGTISHYLLGIKNNTIKATLKNFLGVQRRLTKITNFRGSEIYDDYAHHPTEIISVLNALNQQLIDDIVISTLINV